MTFYGMRIYSIGLHDPKRTLNDNVLSGLGDMDTAHFDITPEDKADIMEEVTTELSVYLGMLYHMVEIFRGHDEFADELSELIDVI